MNTCKVKILGTQDVITLPLSSVEPVCAPDPSAIPEDISDIDVDVLQDVLSQKTSKLYGTKWRQHTLKMKSYFCIGINVQGTPL